MAETNYFMREQCPLIGLYGSIVYRNCHQSSSTNYLVLLELDDHGSVFAAQTESLEETLRVDVANEVVSFRHQLAKRVVDYIVN